MPLGVPAVSDVECSTAIDSANDSLLRRGDIGAGKYHVRLQVGRFFGRWFAPRERYNLAMRTYLSSGDVFLGHQPLGEHSEKPERLKAILDAIDASDLVGRFRWIPPRPATTEELLRVHTETYLQDLRQKMGDLHPKGKGWLDPDTYYGPGTYDAAFHAAGTATELALKIASGREEPGDNGFALVRPPGHHAGPSRAMGFCLFNNVAIAAQAVRATGRRVAIVDFDVHHGNGTEQIFRADGGVLFISLHQFPFYPDTGDAASIGEGNGQGFIVNIPLPEGSGGAEYKLAFRRLVLPALRRFAPDLILVSAGFDGHSRDSLAGMALMEDDYAAMVSQLLSVQSRLLLVLEGGYHREALAASVLAVLRVLIDPSGYRPTGHDAGTKARDSVRKLISDLQQLHRL